MIDISVLTDQVLRTLNEHIARASCFYEYWLGLDVPSKEEIEKYEKACTYADDYDEIVGIWYETKYVADKCKACFEKPIETVGDFVEKIIDIEDINESIDFLEMFGYWC